MASNNLLPQTGTIPKVFANSAVVLTSSDLAKEIVTFRPGEAGPKRHLTHFCLSAPAASSVSLAGEFNGWDPSSLPMARNSEGLWGCALELAAGPHEYRFVVDGEWTNDPLAQRLVANSMGTSNCAFSVEY